jgi:zinc/manganese transport system permease protein
LGITAGVATQAVGALLLLGLLAAPAGASQQFTTRPFAALWLSAGIALVSVWSGLVIAYLAPRVPPSFAILAVATGIYVLAVVGGVGRRRWEDRRPPESGQARALPPRVPDPVESWT